MVTTESTPWWWRRRRRRWRWLRWLRRRWQQCCCWYNRIKKRNLCSRRKAFPLKKFEYQQIFFFPPPRVDRLIKYYWNSWKWEIRNLLSGCKKPKICLVPITIIWMWIPNVNSNKINIFNLQTGNHLYEENET